MENTGKVGISQIIKLTVLATLCAAVSGLHGGEAKIVADTLLVKPKGHLRPEAVQMLLADYGAEERGAIDQIGVKIAHVPANRMAAVLEALRHNPNIEFVEPDLLLPPEAAPSDPYYSFQWHLPKIAAPAAWDQTTGTNTVTIAILDSGIDSTHPDLAPLVIPGWNFYDNNSNTSDVSGHGTAVAGTAAAGANNGLGGVGVTWNCKIMPIRVSDPTGYGDIAAMANGLVYAADHLVRVANISFRASGSFTVSNAAAYFQSKGGVVTVAAGNEGVFDSSAENPFVVTVSATDSLDALPSSSNTGSNVDLCAPGVNILTTSAGGGYGWGSGTSHSAPIVAGVAALVISANPALSGAQVEQILKQSAEDLGTPGWDPTFGWGRVNAERAVLAALAASPVDTTPPTVVILNPVSGSVVSGIVTVNVSASDDTAVTDVEYYVSATLAGSNSSAPAIFSWDTRGYANGSYTLQARAHDAAGNIGASASVTVSVQNIVPDVICPTVQIISPTSGTVVTKSLKVSVSASDNVGVTRVDLLTDGKFYAASSSSTPVFTWNTSKLSRGSHTVQVIAYDAAGNSTRSSVVTVSK